MRAFNKRIGRIGLDVGSCWVKALQLSGDGAHRRIVAAASFPRLEPGNACGTAELGEIASILRRQGLRGREVVVAAPSEKLRSALLELPPRSAGVPMEQLARAEFSRVQKLDVSTSEFSWWELPTPSRAAKGTSVMTVAYPHADAESHVGALESAGFSVAAVDTATSALARACLALNTGQQALAILELGSSEAVLVLVFEGVVAYERRIAEAGISKLLVALSSTLGTSSETAEHVLHQIGLSAISAESKEGDRSSEARVLIVRHFDSAIAEVRKTLSYAAHQYADLKIETMILCGGGARIPGVREHIAGSVSSEIRLADVGQTLACADELRDRVGPQFACAMGLARFA